MPDHRACPDARSLERLLLGLVPESEAGALEQHLAGCPHCAAVVGTLPTRDSLVEALRGSRGLAAGEDRDLVAVAIAALKRLGPAGAATATLPPAATDTLDGTTAGLLAPPEGPEELGRLGPYRVLRVLGVGGMGVVFLAEDPRLHRPVALKAIRPERAARAGARERFLREAQAMAAVEHDHIVPVWHSGEDRGVPFLAMPVLRGESLEDRLQRQSGPLPAAEVARVGREAAAGLAAAHARGLIHRDVKPANIWLEVQSGEPGKYRVKLLDFGLAQALGGSDPGLTHPDALAGTPAYMAPEQARSGPIDARADLFALGCVLYRAATGKLAFPGSDVISTLMAIATEQPAPPHSLNPGLPPALSGLILRLLKKRPEDRPESAAAVAAELRAVERALAEAARPWLSRRRWVLAAGLAALGPVAAAAAWWFRPRPGDEPPGTVTLEADLPGLVLALRRGDGEVVEVTTPLAGPLTLPAGDYTARLTAERPDGRRLVPGSFLVHPGEASAVALRLIGEADVYGGHAGAVLGVAARPGQPRGVLTASLDGSSAVWEAREQQVGTVNLPRGMYTGGARFAARCVAVSHDGKSALTGGGRVGGDLSVRLWDVATAKEVARLPHYQHFLNAVAFFPGGGRRPEADRADARPRRGGRVDLPVRQRPAGEPRLPGERGDARAGGGPERRPAAGGPVAARPGELGGPRGGDRDVHHPGAEHQRRDGDLPVVSELTGPAGRGHTPPARPDPARHPMRLTPLSLIAALLAPAAGAQPPAADEDRPERAALTLETGGHWLPVLHVAFTEDGKRLVTVGRDRAAMVWEVETGKRLKLVRLPTGPGGTFQPTDAALAPDGQTLAVNAINAQGGQYLMLVNLETEQVHHLFAGKDAPARALAFSRGSDLLAAGFGKTVRVWGGKGRDVRKLSGQPGQDPEYTALEEMPGVVRSLAFSPEGDRLAVGADGIVGNLRIWPVKNGGVSPAAAVKCDAGAAVQSIAWGPGGRVLVAGLGGLTLPAGLAHWSPAGKLQKKFALADLNAIGTADAAVTGLAVTAAGRAVVTYERWSGGRAAGATVVTLADGACRAGFQEPDEAGRHRLGAAAVSPDGRLVAHALDWGLAVSVHRVEDGKPVCRVGGKAQVPTWVGWKADGPPVIGWRYGEGAGSQPGFTRTFDLAQLRLTNFAEPQKTGFVRNTDTLGPWSLKNTDTGWAAVRDGKEVRSYKALGAEASARARTLLTGPTGSPLVAWARGNFLRLEDIATGQYLRTYLPNHPYITQVAASPDGKYLLVATGSPRLCVYALEERRPVRNFYALGHDWVAWTEDGYYAATPGGERLVGWTEMGATAGLPTFHPAAHLRKTFNRPDVIQRVLAEGSVAKAVAAANAERAKHGLAVRGATDVGSQLPPLARIANLDAAKLPAVALHIEARAETAAQPLVRLQLLLDGRPLPGENGARPLADRPKQADLDWSVTLPGDLPPGRHTLAVIAHGPDAYSTSEPVAFSVSAAERKPTLHVLAVGVSKYRDSEMNLNCCTNDAEELTRALAKLGGGSTFGPVDPVVLLDDKATAPAIRAALDELKKRCRPGDLAVVFFAGHGAKDADAGLNLLTHEADLNDLKKTCLTGAELKERLASLPCRVLVLLDACHAAAQKTNRKPVSDDLTAELIDDTCGAAVMCAALAQELAGEDASKKHGYFTLGLLAALGGKVQPSEYDGKVYVHDLFTPVERLVRHLSGDQQHPYVQTPTTVDSFALWKP